jgi:hypothetical protein
MHDKRRYIHIFSTNKEINQFIVSLFHHMPPFEREREYDPNFLRKEIEKKNKDANYRMQQCAYAPVLEYGLGYEMIDQTVSFEYSTNDPNKQPIWVGKIGDGDHVATIILYQQHGVTKEKTLYQIVLRQDKIFFWADRSVLESDLLISVFDIHPIEYGIERSERIMIERGHSYGIEYTRVHDELPSEAMYIDRAYEIIASPPYILDSEVYAFEKHFPHPHNLPTDKHSCVVKRGKRFAAHEYSQITTDYTFAQEVTHKPASLFSKNKTKFSCDTIVVCQN